MSRVLNLVCAPLWLCFACAVEPAPPLPARPAGASKAAEPVVVAPVAPPEGAETPKEPAPALAEPLKVAVGDKAEPRQGAARPSEPVLGEWRCKFDDYPPMACTIHKKGAGFWLEKTQGSQRIRGPLARSGDDLTFDGEFFCPEGDCTGRARATLRKTARGWAGTLLHDQHGDPLQTSLSLSR